MDHPGRSDSSRKLGTANNTFSVVDPRLVGILNNRIRQDVDMFTPLRRLRRTGDRALLINYSVRRESRRSRGLRQYLIVIGTLAGSARAIHRP
jgi:hypothetical protein